MANETPANPADTAVDERLKRRLMQAMEKLPDQLAEQLFSARDVDHLKEMLSDGVAKLLADVEKLPTKPPHESEQRNERRNPHQAGRDRIALRRHRTHSASLAGKRRCRQRTRPR